MTKRDETTARNQLAEFAAVDIIGKRNSVTNTLEPIKWIREHKLVWISDEGTGVAIRFLFWIGNRPSVMTTVKVLLMLDGKRWELVSADLESEFQPGKPSREKWVFPPDGTPERIFSNLAQVFDP